MKLSAPIYQLKSQAKKLTKEKSIPIIEALNQIAKREGYQSWSLLQSKKSELLPRSYNEILGYFNLGDLVLIGARPGIGKTSFTMGLFVQAIKEKRKKNYFFTLSEVHKDIVRRIATYDKSIGENNDLFELDYSNDICADYIINKTEGSLHPGSVIVIDYLQLLDQKRNNPSVDKQVERLKVFAKKTECIIIFISQIDRSLEYREDQKPTLSDIRLPNPLDLNLINKKICLHPDSRDSTEVLILGRQDYSCLVDYDPKMVKFN